MEKCALQEQFNRSQKNEKLQSNGISSIQSIINCSEEYNDSLHVKLREQLEKDPNLKIQNTHFYLFVTGSQEKKKKKCKIWDILPSYDGITSIFCP